MRIPHLFILLFQLGSWVRFGSGLDISHRDLELANITCDGKASCNLGKKSRFGEDLDWRDRNCFCDELCRKYGDCCLDSPYYNLVEQRRGAASWNCVNLKHFGGIYMKSMCPPNWNDAKIAAMCENLVDDQDPMSTMPVTSKESGQTYRNVYCALCHSDNAIEFWRPRLECPSLNHRYNISQYSLSSSLKYLSEKESWGITHDKTFHQCNIYPVIPESISYLIRRCVSDVIKTCTVNWTNAEVRTRCEAYTSVIYDFNQAYRNPHCALCNNVRVQYFQCNKVMLRSIFNGDFDPASFAVLFDISGKGNVGKVRQNCEQDQIYDPFFQKCRNVYIEAQQTKGEYFVNIPDNIISNATTIELPNDIFHDSKVRPGEKQLSNFTVKESCPKIVLQPHEYVIMADVLYIPKHQKTFNSNEFELKDNKTVEICLLNYQASELLGFRNKFSPYMGYITFIGLGLSIVFLLCHLVTFAMISELRNLSGKNLASFCVALLFGYLCFITGGQLVKGFPCFVTGILMQYFFLCSFFWELIMSFDVWRTLRLATAELRVSNGKQWRKFTVYSLICWLVPGLIVMITVLIDMSAGGFIQSQYKPDFGVTSCWFGQRLALLIFFALPLAMIMILNILFFISSAYMIYSTTSLTRFTASSSTQRDFRLYVRLALIMGLTWSVGLFAGYIDNEPLWYAFIALNTLQGVFIFLAFTCTNKMIRNLFKSSSSINRPIRPASFSCSNTDMSNNTNSTKKSQIIHSDNHDMLI
ncbi:hypothetical protein M8J77_016905 [Diaphorina citri]|nr:hypothetical protein M8J77_016905 [Diaphorina citri]